MKPVSYKVIKRGLKELESLYNDSDIIQFSLWYKIIFNQLRYKFYYDNIDKFDFELYFSEYEKNFRKAFKYYDKLLKTKALKNKHEKFNRNNIEAIKSIENYYAHPNKNRAYQKFIPKSEFILIKSNLKTLVQILFNKNEHINIVAEDKLLNELEEINYIANLNILHKWKIKFNTPNVQRTISWDEKRTHSFLDGAMNNSQEVSIKVFKDNNEFISVFDGQHRFIVLIYLFYLIVGKEIEYYISDEKINFVDWKFTDKQNSIKNLLTYTKNWFLSNSSLKQELIDKILKLEILVEEFEEEDYAKVFFVHNTQPQFVEKSPHVDEIINKISSQFILKYKDILYISKKISQYIDIVDDGYNNSHRSFSIDIVDFGKFKPAGYKEFLIYLLLKKFSIDDSNQKRDVISKVTTFFKRMAIEMGKSALAAESFSKIIFTSLFIHRGYSTTNIFGSGLSNALSQLNENKVNIHSSFIKFNKKYEYKRMKKYLGKGWTPTPETFCYDRKFEINGKDKELRFSPSIYDTQTIYYPIIANKSEWYSSVGKYLISENENKIMILPKGWIKMSDFSTDNGLITRKSNEKVEWSFSSFEEARNHLIEMDFFKYSTLYSKRDLKNVSNFNELFNLLKKYEKELDNEIEAYNG